MTKAEILTAVQNRTARGSTITSIDTELLAVLIDITARHPFLKSSEAQSWTSGTASKDFPTGANRILMVTCQLTAGGDTDPLIEIPFSKYLDKNRSSDSGVPQYWSVYNNEIYLYPKANDTYTVTVYYSYIHPTSLVSILLGEAFRECVTEGTVFKWYEGIGRGDAEGVIHKQIYENDLATLGMRIADQVADTVSGYY